MDNNLDADVKAVGRIPVVSAILEMICAITGMGFAAVARVTPERWIACAVRDEIQFGLVPGGELKVDTTICHEIRQTGTEVVIDHVAQSPGFSGHHTPAMYGFQSYISVPLRRSDNSFFGTLCAIDPSPALLNVPEIVSLFKTFADLISLHLDAATKSAEAAVQALEERTFQEVSRQLAALRELPPVGGQGHAGQRLADRRDQEFLGRVRAATDKIRSLVAVLAAD